LHLAIFEQPGENNFFSILLDPERFIFDTDNFHTEYWKNQPFDYPRSDPSTALRTSARGLPFDKLKVPSIAEGLRVDTEGHF